jgi:hypothetical protein
MEKTHVEERVTVLYKKIGKRYKLVGNSYPHSETDRMNVGEWRLVHCTTFGSRTYHDVKPDNVAFKVAALEARERMEEAISREAKFHPDFGRTGKPYTAKQLEVIEEFRQKMIECGGLLPTWWTSSSAYNIAKVAIDCVES